MARPVWTGLALEGQGKKEFRGRKAPKDRRFASVAEGIWGLGTRIAREGRWRGFKRTARCGEWFVGEARAGDEDGRAPAEAKGRAVAADAQSIGGAGGDGDGVAGRGDDAGGGEGFQELPLPRGAPAVGADLLGGGGEAVREGGSGRTWQSSCLGEGLPGRYQG